MEIFYYFLHTLSLMIVPAFFGHWNPNFGWYGYAFFFFIYEVECHQIFITDVRKVILVLTENQVFFGIKMFWKIW